MTDKPRLNLMQREILTWLCDGKRLNLFAWPMMDEDESALGTLKIVWAVAWLHVRGLLDTEEDDEDRVWLSITPQGRAALAEDS